MKQHLFYTLIALFFALAQSTAQETIISYYSPNPGKKIQKSLFAKIGNQEYKLLDSSAACYAIVDIRDFNNDQFKDVLVANVQGCGGDCCANSFFFFSYNPQKAQFVKTKEVGYDFRERPNIYKWADRWSIGVEAENRISTKSQIEKYALLGDTIVSLGPQIKEPTPVKLQDSVTIITTINALNIDKNKTGLRKIIQHDLNGDGLIDSIVASYWSTWDAGLHWHIAFGNGTIDQKAQAIKQLSILSSKTNNYHDILIDSATIWRWYGQEYSDVPPKVKPNYIDTTQDGSFSEINQHLVVSSLDFFYYKVKKNESLSVIAKKQKSSVDAIKALNGKISDRIKTGESLKIPKRENGGFKIHVVIMGETLWEISRKYKIPVDNILAANNMTNDTIKFGNTLKIPKN